MTKIVVFSGAGMSAESGISTFRDSDGLWAKYKIEDVCTPEALRSNRERVVEFYNIRRKELLEKSPNSGHYVLADMENYFDIEVVTQNIDDLHERAGSKRVTHLHGELMKLRSSVDETEVVDIDGWEQKIDARHKDGSLLRPFVVFFGESVPMFDKAVEIVSKADILIVIGTSLAVYPAASLINYTKNDAIIYLIDPNDVNCAGFRREILHIKANATQGLNDLKELLIENYSNK